MMIVFKRSHIFNGKKRVIGAKTRVTEDKGKELIEQNIADIYTGDWPPKTKTKTNFFKPK
jgi:hypothetical protein